MVRVLFVCLGNICRSPMVEAVFRKMIVEGEFADEIAVDSAGTASWHTGKQPHEGTREILDRYRIPYEGMQARQISKGDWNKFDYMIVMDDQNKADLDSMYRDNSDVVVKKLTDFVEDEEVTFVPDPYYTGDFDYTYRLVVEGSKNLLAHIKEKHNI